METTSVASSKAQPGPGIQYMKPPNLSKCIQKRSNNVASTPFVHLKDPLDLPGESLEDLEDFQSSFQRQRLISGTLDFEQLFAQAEAV